ncbi:MAG: 2,4-dienoyl-CoA reductase-like NADH-dependent reductase (Old Yellow Enzyme family) [Planctomycetota bacterium]|jgi:2,4-dienoyl-CoA reductase-like NADH-dependent reductase (Old Yellow Enzyme family)
MWKPTERIKYKAEVGHYPTAEQAASSLWYSPIDVGQSSLRQRTWVPAMVPRRSTDEGFATKDVVDWYSRFAEGRPGAIVVEATGIRDIPSGPLLRIGDDRFIPGLKELTAAVHKASQGETRLFIQLIDFLSIRRRPAAEKYFKQFLIITDEHREKLNMENEEEAILRERLLSLPDEELNQILNVRELEALRMGSRERVTDMDLEHVRALPSVLPNLFAQAARRAKEAGFDGVELHYAHAYTMASFLSAKNDRDDGYGGSRESRVRLPLEVFQQVRKEVGDEYTVGCRFLSDECIDGGSDVEDAMYYAVKFAEAGMDFLSLSRGGKFEDAKQPLVGWSSYPYTGKSGYECMPGYISDEFGPFGRNIEPTSRIRHAIREEGHKTPVVVIGGIFSYEQAETILKNGDADIVGSARQSLADPDWFRKTLLGRGKEIRTCTFTNYCEGLDQKHKQVTCQLWDREDREGATSLSIDGKRRLIAPAWKMTS